jgi:hypothetical protein
MNIDRLTPPKDCDDLPYWLSCVVWDAIRDARDAGMSDTDAAYLLDSIARTCARQADLYRATPATVRGALLPCAETRCVGFGEVDCDGWPRWSLTDPDWIANLAVFVEDPDDDSSDYYFREWSSTIDDDDYAPAADAKHPPWEMFPERFADPRTWCGTGQP